MRSTREVSQLTECAGRVERVFILVWTGRGEEPGQTRPPYISRPGPPPPLRPAQQVILSCFLISPHIQRAESQQYKNLDGFQFSLQRKVRSEEY